MSVHLYPNLAPMTPTEPMYSHYGDDREPAIVDPSSSDWASSQSYYPLASMSSVYTGCHDPSSSYPSSFPLNLPIFEQPPAPIAMNVPGSDPLPTSGHDAVIAPAHIKAEEEQEQVEAPIQPAVQVDMNMAKQGTWSASPGFRTPLADYVAQIASWLWFAQRPATQPQPSSEDGQSPSAAEESLSALSINPLQVSVPFDFGTFVNRMLQATQVSHSVVILSLLYLSRLTDKQGVWGVQGTENGAYVASLMLANKYLDDNTYTNKTWAELSLIPLHQVNTMEQHFLTGIDYRLTVQRKEFDGFTRALDGFMLSHQRHATRQHAITGVEAHSSHSSTIPSSSTFREQPRARSHSPHETSAEPTPAMSTDISPTTGRKRSAGDAFQVDTTPTEQVAKSMRVPSRRGYVHLQGVPNSQPQPVASSLGRAASLSRNVASAYSTTDTRRGSTPSMATHYTQAAAARMAAVTQGSSNDYSTASQWQPMLQMPQQQMMPQNAQAANMPPQIPQHLMFYTLAAEAHPGADGHRRKGTLHFQAPPQQYYDPNMYAAGQQNQAGPSTATQAPALGPSYAPTSATHQPIYAPGPSAPSTGYQGYSYPPPSAPAQPTPNPFGYPPQQFAFGRPAIPEPAQFANAGPPAYQYQPDGYNPQQQMLPVPQNYAFAPSYPAQPVYQFQHQHQQQQQPQQHPQHHLQPAMPVQPQQQGNWHQSHPSWDGSNQAQHPHHSRVMMQSRSEWSSPMPGYGPFHPHGF